MLKVKELRRIELNTAADPATYAILVGRASAWASFVGSLSPERSEQIRGLALRLYVRVFENYMGSRRATKMADLNRAFSKTLKDMHLGIDFKSFVEGLQASRTIPIIVHATERGGHVVCPSVVGQTLVMRGEVSPHDFYNGLVEGPVLSENGLRLVFEDKNFDVGDEVTQFVTPTGSLTPPVIPGSD